MSSKGVRCLTVSPASASKTGETASTATVPSGLPSKRARKSTRVPEGLRGSTSISAPSTCSVLATINSNKALCSRTWSAWYMASWPDSGNAGRFSFRKRRASLARGDVDLASQSVVDSPR